MPVRFRCSYCNQLLGISRRKIGTAIKCPTCQGQVVVPPHSTEDNPPGPPPMPQPVAAPPRQFERSDFEIRLQDQAAPAASIPIDRPRAHEPAYPIPSPPGDVEVDVEQLPRTQEAPKGLVLTPIKMTVLAIGVVIALAIAFAAGVVVGMAISAAAEPKSSVITEE